MKVLVMFKFFFVFLKMTIFWLHLFVGSWKAKAGETRNRPTAEKFSRAAVGTIFPCPSGKKVSPLLSLSLMASWYNFLRSTGKVVLRALCISLPSKIFVLFCTSIVYCIKRGFQLAGEAMSHLLMTVEDEAPEGGVAEEEGGGPTRGVLTTQVINRGSA